MSPPPAAVELQLVPSGARLLESLAGRHEYVFDIDDITEPTHRQLAARALDELRDLAEILDEVGLEQREAAVDRATELMVELLESELLTAVGPYERRLTGDGESTPWSGLVVRIAPAAVVAARQRAVQDQPAAPTERDQRQLDQLLGFLTRPSMRAIAEQDFLSPWPQRITTPLSYFVHEQDEVEHRFTDQALEERRQLLLQACNHFLHQEAFNGFSSRVPGRRDGGWTPSDAEGHADREAVLERRRSVLSSAAKDVLDAYDTLIETAGDRGYSLEAMSAERLPRVEAFDREMDQL